jgi:hypothetical protein
VGNNTALVTGGTAGIGAAFARRLAGEGYDLVLVARDADRLASFGAELAEAHGVTATPLPADLSTAEGCDAVAARIDAGIDVLVNNAGFGLNLSFLKSTVEQEEKLLALNVHAVMRLTLAALPGMFARRSGDIVNVSSVSAFAPMMPGSTYPATKAWVNSFSESIHLLARPYGVRVCALCPGYTRTEFHQRAGIDMSKTPDWMWLDADTVVRDGLRDLRKGKPVSVPDWRYKVASFGLRHLPRSLVQRAARDTRGRIGRDEVDAAPQQ